MAGQRGPARPAATAAGFGYAPRHHVHLHERCEWVGGTSIYARRVGPDRQALVYEMSFRAPEPVAMVLPLPTPGDGASEDDVRFVDFRRHGQFFSRLRRTYEMEPWWARLRRWWQRRRGVEVYSSEAREVRPLVVHEIGNFEASFVPTREDFARLDERFQLEGDVWRGLRRYADHGFAVFQLRPGAWTAHPMALEFTTRDPARLYFPTVHVHDGKVHPFARFEHELFAHGVRRQLRWRRAFKETGRALGARVPLVDTSPGAFCYRRTIVGYRPNRDTWIRVAPEA